MTLQVAETQCKTCPFRKEGWTCVRELLMKRALTEASPICHSTGSTALVKKAKRTNQHQKICRGARNFQLQFFHGIGFIDKATDEAWNKKLSEMRLPLRPLTQTPASTPPRKSAGAA